MLNIVVIELIVIVFDIVYHIYLSIWKMETQNYFILKNVFEK